MMISWKKTLSFAAPIVIGGFILTIGQGYQAEDRDDAIQSFDVSLSETHKQDFKVSPPRSQPEDSEAQVENKDSGLQWHEIPSLAGSTINGDIKEDQNGNLIVDRDLRRLFEYFLSLRGRYSFAQIQELFLGAIQGKVGDKAKEQVLDLLKKYQNYLNESTAYLREIETQPNVEDFEYLLNQRKHLRRSYLGEETSEAFFYDAERYEEHQLMVLRISTDPNLTDDEKKQMLEENDASLPPDLYVNRQKTFAYSRLKSELRQTKDDVKIYESVAERFGDAAAQRYIEALQAEKSWKQKVKEYFAKKDSFFSDLRASDEEAEIRWRQHSEGLYSRRELARLRAIESERQIMH
ncbi:MAG: lipase secretion chaperone [Oligoflexus sp.]